MLGLLWIAQRDVVLMCRLCNGGMICVHLCECLRACVRAWEQRCVHWSRALSDHPSSPSLASSNQPERHPVLQEDHYPHPFIRWLPLSAAPTHTHLTQPQSSPMSRRRPSPWPRRRSSVSLKWLSAGRHWQDDDSPHARELNNLASIAV